MGEVWYGSYDNDLKYLLYRYEEYLATEAGETISEDVWEKIWSGTPATTIEHIHPKTFTDKWKGKIGDSQEQIDEVVNGIGNLILLPPGINSKAGQKTFAEKKEIYKSYHLLMLNEILKLDDWEMYMSTENSVNRSLKTRSLLTKFGTCSIAATGAVTTLLLFRSRFHCAVRFRGVCRNRLPYQSDKLCM